MTTDVTEIINAISNALGIVYDKAVDLYPSVVKMNIVDDVFGLICGVFLCCIGYHLLCRCYKKWVKENKDSCRGVSYDIYAGLHSGFVVIGFFASLIGLFMTFSCINDLAQWIVAPDIKSIIWVQNLFK